MNTTLSPLPVVTVPSKPVSLAPRGTAKPPEQDEDRLSLGTRAAHAVTGGLMMGAIGGAPLGCAQLTVYGLTHGNWLLALAGGAATCVAAPTSLGMMAMTCMLADTPQGARVLQASAIAGIAGGVTAAALGVPLWISGTLGASVAGAVIGGSLPH